MSQKNAKQAGRSPRNSSGVNGPSINSTEESFLSYFTSNEGTEGVFLDNIISSIFAAPHKQRRATVHKYATKEERDEARLKKKEVREEKRRERDEAKIYKLKEKLEKKSAQLGLSHLIENNNSSSSYSLSTSSIYNSTLSNLLSTPSYWTSFSEDNPEYLEVLLEESSDEFKNLSAMMNSNISSHHGGFGTVNNICPTSFNIEKIVRIQNLELWSRLQFARNLIAKNNSHCIKELESSKYITKYPIKTPLLDESSNEYYLFHGTKWDVINKIKKRGFDERVGSVNGMFGAGIYFAEISSKSNQYIPCPQCLGGAIFSPNPVCNCKEMKESFGMIVCRVLLGDVHISIEYEESKYKGEKDNPIRRPPPKQSNGLDLFDSILAESKINGGTKLNHREFIVYDRLQVYPEYIIYFNRVAPPPDPIATSEKEETAIVEELSERLARSSVNT